MIKETKFHWYVLFTSAIEVVIEAELNENRCQLARRAQLGHGQVDGVEDAFAMTLHLLARHQVLGRVEMARKSPQRFQVFMLGEYA